MADAEFCARDLRSLLQDYTRALGEFESEINRVNVFPVADADTGSNMLGTMKAVVGAIAQVGDEMSRLTRAVKRGALMGAQGNSGIILSQWLRGFVGHLDEIGSAGPAEVAAALHHASAAAYEAVDEPKEGTILTVARLAAEATTSMGEPRTLDQVWSAAARGGDLALLETTSRLDVLRENDVVDSGGYGLAILFDVAGEEPILTSGGGKVEPVSADAAVDSGWYEVTLLIETDEIPALRSAWSDLGYSVDITGGEDDPWSCHVHTSDIGAALEAAVEVGRPYRIRVLPIPPPSSDF